jgi:phage baseplate assembly protein gpV
MKKFYAVATLFLLAPALVSDRPARAIDRSWTAGNGSWSNGANWSPAGVPANVDIARIGNLVGVQGDTVFLDQNDTIAGLQLSNGMALQTQGFWMVVNGETSLTGPGTRLNIFDTIFGTDFETDDLAIGPGARVLLEDSAVRINGQLSLNDGQFSRLYPSAGLVEFSAASGTTLSNGGTIRGGPGTMLFLQLNDGLYDLDGPLGDGEILVSGNSDASMTFIGQGLTDSFSGSLRLGPNATLAMNIFNGWEADAASTIDVFMFSEAKIAGSAVRLAGAINVSSVADFRVQADATLASTAMVDIGANARIEFVPFWSATVEGGNFSVGHQGVIAFGGETILRGGTFTTPSNLSVDGVVRFDGETEWDGSVTFNGIARQVGPSSVIGATTISADVFDMDGNGGTVWNIHNNAVIQADSIDSSISNTFDGTLNVAGGFSGRLTVNLTDAFDQWTMAGAMNLAGVAAAAFPIDRLGGSHVRITGDLNVNHRVRIAADTTIAENSSVTFTAPTTVLQMTGNTHVTRTVNFIGGGILENGITGDMTIGDGVELIQAGLTNHGILRVGDSTGVATVNRFIQGDTGTWIIELGGYLEAVEHDVLVVETGSASLDGLIEVDLLNLGGGVFFPVVGDEFTILRTLGGVAGTFANSPVSFAAGHNFYWTVLYEEHFVKLRLDDIAYVIPEPSGVALFLTGVAMLIQRVARRRTTTLIRSDFYHSFLKISQEEEQR